MNLLISGIDEDMDRVACGEMVEELDAADFDDAVGAIVETGGFRIEDDLTHSGNLLGNPRFQVGDDLEHPFPRLRDTVTGVDQIIGPPPFFRVRCLAGENHA